MIKIKNIGLGLLVAGVMGCSTAKDDFWQSYTIKQGEHKSEGNRSYIIHNCLYFEAILDESCLYNQNDLENKCQGDWNKFMGFNKHILGDHHKHSARFSWRAIEDSFEIGYYTYVNKERTSGVLDTVKPNEIHDYMIADVNGKYMFYIDGTLLKEIDCKSGTKKNLLYPYFGGDCTAPHDMKIDVRFLK